MSTVQIGWPLAGVVVVLSILAAGVTWAGHLGSTRQPLMAAGRAVLQLLAVSTVIGAVLRSMLWTALFLAVMVIVAAGTSARRVTGSLRAGSWWTVTAITAGVAPTVAVIVVSSVVPWDPIAVLPVAGILIGGAMTATTLAARRMADELDSHHGAYEAGLSLGLARRDSALLVGRQAAALALIPGLDQTRTVGLVTLPGAFVGVLLAGASPWQAGAAQVLVLVGLLLTQSIAVAVTVELVATGRLPAPTAVLQP